MIATALQLLLLSTAVCLPFLCLVPGPTDAGLDLAPSALLRVSSLRSERCDVDDRHEGPLALQDLDPATAWRPEPGDPSEIVARVQGAAGDAVTLTRIVLRYASPAVLPERVEWAGVVLPHSSCVVEGSSVVCRPPRRPGRWLRVRLPAQEVDNGRPDRPDRIGSSAPIGDLEVSALELYAEPTIPVSPPRPEVRAWKHGVVVRVAPVPGALAFDVERRIAGRPVHVFRTASGSVSALDRPPAGPVEYAVRAIGFGGAASSWSEPARLEFVPPVAPSLPVFGVVEGFYGRPWTWAERTELLRLAAAIGMNQLVYAPKDDPLHRDDWRTPYPAEELLRFSALLAEASALSMQVSLGISPGLSMAPGSEEDFAALLSKLDPLLDVGFPSVTLLMDDISKSAKTPQVGAAHARLTERLHEHLVARGVSLQFVGTVYAGTADSLEDEHRGYLTALGHIPPEVPVMWTGDGVFDARMDPHHADGIARLLGRKPLVWDNFPVNDFAARSQRLFLGPVTGRASDLFPSISGLLSNPMTHATASIFSLVSYGELVAGRPPRPSADDLATAFGLPAGSGALLTEFAQDHEGSPKMLPDRLALPELSALVQRFLAALDGGRHDAVLQPADDLLQALAQRYLSDSMLWQEACRPPLANDFAAPLIKRRLQLEAAMEAVSLLASEEAHPWGPGRLAALLADSPRSPLSWRWFGLEEAVQPLLERARNRCLRNLEPVRNSASALAPPPLFPTEVVASEPFPNPCVQRPASCRLLGDGIRPTDDERLVAERPGFLRVVVVASDGPVVAATGFELFVREGEHELEGGKAAPLVGGLR